MRPSRRPPHLTNRRTHPGQRRLPRPPLARDVHDAEVDRCALVPDGLGDREAAGDGDRREDVEQLIGLRAADLVPAGRGGGGEGPEGCVG